MIVYKLKNLLQNKNVVFFSICHSTRSEFITEAATEISSSKQLFCNCSQKARKTSLKVHFLVKLLVGGLQLC